AGEPFRRGEGDRRQLHRPPPRRRDGPDPVRQPGLPGDAAHLGSRCGTRATAGCGGGPGRHRDGDRRCDRDRGEAIVRLARAGAGAGAAHRRRQQRRQHRAARSRARRQGGRRAHLHRGHRRHPHARAGLLRQPGRQSVRRSRRRDADEDRRRDRRPFLPRHRCAGTDAAARSDAAAAQGVVHLAARRRTAAVAARRAATLAAGGGGGMNVALAQLHFLRPWWLCALVVLPWLLWQASRRSRGLQALSRLVDVELLPSLLQGRSTQQGLPLGLLALAWLLAVLALAGPAWSRVEQPLYARRAAQVVAISLSQRMLSHDVAPSRIDRARFKAHDLLTANHDGLNALVGYAGEAFVVAPLTSDVHSLGTLLDAMAPDTMPVGGDDAAAAIARGAALIRDAKVGGGSLVLIADTAGTAAQAAARQARSEGVRVSVLGVGTLHGAPVALPGGGFLHDAKGDLQLAGREDAALAAV